MSETTSTAIYRELRTRIVNNYYGKGRFLGERDIAEEFGVSRAPVRDALQRLTQEGFLNTYPRKGHAVNRITMEQLQEIQQIRFQLETLSLALVIRNASDEDLARIPLHVSSEDALNPYHTENTCFHLGLAQLSGNEMLIKNLYRYLGDSSLGAFQNPEIVRSSSNCHEELLSAIRSRDLLASQQMLAKDLQLTATSTQMLALPIA
ncbi:MAG: GntR family transcriptional regulator [Candidatus Choladocola sp.]|nr:GntR family transcriptional regulator [Candidatus Choladocola sp.]